MPNIVIVGAGALGRYLAAQLSKDNHNIVLVDRDKKRLEEIAWNTDVATRVGGGTDWQLLDDLLEQFPDLLLALTNSDETNLVACSIAKQLGYPAAIARLHDNRFLNRTRLDFGRLFHVDHFIAPEFLVANEIMKTIVNKGASAVDYFAHGAVQLCSFRIGENWQRKNIPLNILDLPKGVMVGLIYRQTAHGDQILFPHGSDCLLPGDEVTFIGETEEMSSIQKYCGVKSKEISSVVIIGGSLTAMQLARLLERREIAVKIIERDYERCIFLAEELPYATIINHDGLDLEFLKAEKITQANLLIACTKQDELNLMISTLAKEAGCENVLTVLSSASYKPIVEKLGIHQVISPLQIASSRIQAYIFTETLTSLVSLYESRAEVLEVKVSMDSKVVGIPISDLGPLFPKDFLIAMIQNRGRIMVANGNRIISPGDTVIVITNPKHIPEIEAIF